MKKLAFAIVVIATLYYGLGQTGALGQFAGIPTTQAQSSQVNEKRSAFAEPKSGTQFTGEGVVTKLLADDSEGSRHQRFILALPSGQTLLVAHNIDIAPRLDTLRPGDFVEFNGVYEWNAKGGVIHWTHRDPSGRHQAGWLKHAGRIYQ